MAPRTANTRTIAQREIGRALMVRELAQGRTHAEIADMLGVDRSQVSYDWGKVKAEIRQMRTAKAEELVDAEIAKLEALQAECMEGWRRSLGESVEHEWEGGVGPNEIEAQKGTQAQPEAFEASPGVYVEAGHWKPKKKNPPKPNPAFLMTWNALERTKLELVGLLKQREANEGREQERADPIPQASRVTELEAASRALEKLEGLTGGRMLKFKRAG